MKLTCDIIKIDGRNVVDSRGFLRSVLEAREAGHSKYDIAASAQVTLAQAFAVQACDAAKTAGVPIVGFSGGVAVNAAIGKTIEDYVEKEGLKFVTNHKLPCGDGGVSFGQAVLAARAIK